MSLRSVVVLRGAIKGNLNYRRSVRRPLATRELYTERAHAGQALALESGLSLEASVLSDAACDVTGAEGAACPASVSAGEVAGSQSGASSGESGGDGTGGDDEGGGDDDDPEPPMPLRGGSSSIPGNPLPTYLVILVFTSQAFFTVNAALNLEHLGQSAMVALCSLLMMQLAFIAGLRGVPLRMPKWLRRLIDWMKGGGAGE